MKPGMEPFHAEEATQAGIHGLPPGPLLPGPPFTVVLGTTRTPTPSSPSGQGRQAAISLQSGHEPEMSLYRKFAFPSTPSELLLDASIKLGYLIKKRVIFTLSDVF